MFLVRVFCGDLLVFILCLTSWCPQRTSDPLDLDAHAGGCETVGGGGPLQEQQGAED